jgi:type 1 glutamine amidotransferase
MTAPVHVTLVAGGKYHDIDYARLELLKLLAEDPDHRVEVRHDYEDIDTIVAGSVLVSYTVDVRPSPDAQQAIRSWVEAGGRWLALHGTNSALTLGGPDGVDSPRVFPLWADTIGSQFIAHPPIAPFLVEPVADVVSDVAWLIDGIEAFETDDELYLSEYHERDQLIPMLTTRWNGTAPGFVESDWTDTESEHLVMYLRPLGRGAVLYNALGHVRGHHDMQPIMDYYPRVELGAWAHGEYLELLRRSLRWARGLTA